MYLQPNMSSEALNAAVIALQVICGVAIVCNLVVVAVFAGTTGLRSTYYGFLFNLVLADIAAPTFDIIYKYQPGKVPLALVRTSFCAAELSILAVAANRLLAFSMPRDHFRALVTRGRMVVAWLLIWVVSALLYVPLTFVEAEGVRLMRPLLALTVIAFTGVLYYMVFRKISCYSGHDDAGENLTRVRQTRHLMVTFTIILVTSLCCWLPLCIGDFVIYSSKGFDRVSSSFKVFYKFCFGILLIKSVINPFIYWWRVGDFREGLRCVLCVRRNQKENTELEATAVETVM